MPSKGVAGDNTHNLSVLSVRLLICVICLLLCGFATCSDNADSQEPNLPADAYFRNYDRLVFKPVTNLIDDDRALTMSCSDLRILDPLDEIDGLSEVVFTCRCDDMLVDRCFEGLSECADAICSDHATYYGTESLTSLTIAVASASLMANTDFDHDWIRQSLNRNGVLSATHPVRRSLKFWKNFGEGQYAIPIYACVGLLDPCLCSSEFGRTLGCWGQRSFRTVLVGAPTMLALQVLTGASRPGESRVESRWKMFDDANGVSGHAFVGAIPFLTAASMTERVWVKRALYVASALPAASRVTDDDHYASQAVLGWCIAALAASAVVATDRGGNTVQIHPLQDNDRYGIGFTFAY